jgi:hypothetical protein
VIADVSLVNFQCFVGASDGKFSIGHPGASSADLLLIYSSHSDVSYQ